MSPPPATTQGGGPSTHGRAARSTLPVQHCGAPPGRLAHPPPPQRPHDAAQHAVPERMPRAQVGSELVEGAVVGALVGALVGAAVSADGETIMASATELISRQKNLGW